MRWVGEVPRRAGDAHDLMAGNFEIVWTWADAAPVSWVLSTTLKACRRLAVWDRLPRLFSSVCKNASRCPCLMSRCLDVGVEPYRGTHSPARDSGIISQIGTQQHWIE